MVERWQSQRVAVAMDADGGARPTSRPTLMQCLAVPMVCGPRTRRAVLDVNLAMPRLHDFFVCLAALPLSCAPRSRVLAPSQCVTQVETGH